MKLYFLTLIVFLALNGDVQAQQAAAPQNDIGYVTEDGSFALSDTNPFVGRWVITGIAGADGLYSGPNLQRAQQTLGKEVIIRQNATATMHSGLECILSETGGLALSDGSYVLEDETYVSHPQKWSDIGFVMNPATRKYSVNHIGFACLEASVPVEENYHTLMMSQDRSLTVMNIWDVWMVVQKGSAAP